MAPARARLKRILCVIGVCFFVAPRLARGASTSLSRSEIEALRDEVKEMFTYTLESYNVHAYPADELKPMSCEGVNTFGSESGFAVTLIDALDAMVVMGNKTAFERGVRAVIDNTRFDVDAHVSLFEMNIRVLGGLLSAHLLASDEATGFGIEWYEDELLELANDLGEAFLPAFETKTGIPYGAVNLKYGVEVNETTITSTAAGGSLILEFGTLSALTGDPRFRRVAEAALEALWDHRSDIGLVGAHIDIETGQWTQAEASVGAGIDSFYEYMLKSYILFGNERHLEIFEEAYAAVEAHVRLAPWYVEAGMMTGQLISSRYDSLMSFWPGLQALYGDIETATTTHDAFFQVWKHYGFTPEGFDVRTGAAIPGQKPYPLRPELIESTYLLYKATGDVTYIACGRDFLASLRLLKTNCGYAHMADVSTQKLVDKMESFFLSETLKYLYLLFDAALDRENIVDGGPYPYLFTTEAHILPLKPGIGARDNRGRPFRTFSSITTTAAKNTAASLVRSIVRGGSMVMKNMRDDDEPDKRTPDKFCLYHSLLWQIGLKPAPERPHNLTQRLEGLTGRPDGVRTFMSTVQEFFERMKRPDHRLAVRLGLSSLVSHEEDVIVASRLAVMLERTHKYLREVSDEYFDGRMCASVQEFRLIATSDTATNDTVEIVFKTKTSYQKASACVGKALIRVLGTLMHSYAYDIGSVYDCAVSKTTYIPYTDFEDPNASGDNVETDDEEERDYDDDDDDDEYEPVVTEDDVL